MEFLILNDNNSELEMYCICKGTTSTYCDSYCSVRCNTYCNYRCAVKTL